MTNKLIAKEKVEASQKTVKEQLEERKINLDHVLAFSEDNQEFYTVGAVAVVFDSLVAELQKEIETLETEQNIWFELSVQVEIDTYKYVLDLLGVKEEKK